MPPLDTQTNFDVHFTANFDVRVVPVSLRDM